MPFAATLVGLEIIVLSEVSQTEKDKCHVILLIFGMVKNIQATPAAQFQKNK